MNTKTILLLLFIAALNFGFSTCVENPFQKSKLPKEMPEKTSMRFNKNGGMAPTWYSIRISGDQIEVEDKKMSDENSAHWHAKLSPEDKASLYQVFVTNKFDLVENDKRKDIVYDAPSEGIYLRAGTVSKNVSSGMNSPLSGRNSRRYSAVKAAFIKLAANYESKGKSVKKNFVAIEYNSRKHTRIFAEGTRVKLSYVEIEKAEALIKKAISEYNADRKAGLMIKDFSKYRHQLVPIMNRREEKEIWVNSLCTEQPRWNRKVITVKDGGNCFFNLYLNLDKNSFENFYVNGDGYL